MRQLWFVYYNSERNLVVRMKISKNRHKLLGVIRIGEEAVLKTVGADEAFESSNLSAPVFNFLSKK